MIIKSHEKDYDVVFENNISFIKKLGKISDAFFVVDQRIYDLYNEIILSSFPQEKTMTISAVESNKTIETALKICERMTKFSAKRNAVIISVGGGITQDITGFTSNILYRGVHWIFVPTTLLAECDSCIGSKTSLNYLGYKNLLGTFYSPDKIYICPEFTKTLSQTDFLSGLGEVVKFNIMAGQKNVHELEENIKTLLERQPDVIIRYIRNSLEFKKKFIELDEYDRNERIFLNFGHTFGHAIEGLTDYAVPHGTAVAMGTIMACDIAHERDNISGNSVNAINNLLRQIINPQLLCENGFEMTSIMDTDEFIDKIKKDKKQINDDITAVIFKDDELNLEVIHDVKRSEVSHAIRVLRTILGEGL